MLDFKHTHMEIEGTADDHDIHVADLAMKKKYMPGAKKKRGIDMGEASQTYRYKCWNVHRLVCFLEGVSNPAVIALDGTHLSYM